MTTNTPMAYLLAQFDGDEVFVRQMLHLFISQSTELEARLQAAFRNQAESELLALSHELKGMALNVGADTVAQAALALEQAAKEGQSIASALSALQTAIQTAQNDLTAVL